VSGGAVRPEGRRQYLVGIDSLLLCIGFGGILRVVCVCVRERKREKARSANQTKDKMGREGVSDS